MTTANYYELISGLSCPILLSYNLHYLGPLHAQWGRPWGPNERDEHNDDRSEMDWTCG